MACSVGTAARIEASAARYEASRVWARVTALLQCLATLHVDPAIAARELARACSPVRGGSHPRMSVPASRAVHCTTPQDRALMARAVADAAFARLVREHREAHGPARRALRYRIDATLYQYPGLWPSATRAGWERRR